jgi:hypothetical protein
MRLDDLQSPACRGEIRYAGPRRPARERTRRAGRGRSPRRAQLAWLTVDMLKSGTRTAGMTVRVK